MNESIFNDFDQKTVTGTQVLSAYNQMNGKPVAVNRGSNFTLMFLSEIAPKLCKGNWVNYNAIVAPFASGSTSQTAAPFSGDYMYYFNIKLRI